VTIGAFAHHDHLVDKQRDLVRAWCASGNRYQAAIGRAGAGKTTSVAAASEAWLSMGSRVMGAAVKGEAARTLAGATGIERETVAWYLAHDDNGANPSPPARPSTTSTGTTNPSTQPPYLSDATTASTSVSVGGRTAQLGASTDT
jgi:hypothetical protein